MEKIIFIVFGIVVIVILIHLEFLIMKNSKHSDTGNLIDEVKTENQMVREIIMQQQKIQNEATLGLTSALKDSLHSMGMEMLKNSSDGQKQI